MSKPEYELVYSTQGDIFQNKKTDAVFVVYNSKLVRISIVVYNDQTNSYFDLYRDIKIENGLAKADCNYGHSGTLDYQLGDNLVYHVEDLIKKPLRFLDHTLCKIGSISRDKDFVLAEGCFMSKAAKSQFINSSALCISTSTVYNNWECLTYDRTKNAFVLFYGQAFAD